MILGKMGNDAILIGLSEENIKRLKEDKPIMQEIEGRKVIIVYGKTEMAIVNRLKKEGLIDTASNMETKGIVHE